jgi:hypothetical protein
MAELFASGRIVDLILGLMALEAVVLLAYRSKTGKGVAPVDLLVNLASGVFLFLALRAALTGAPWTTVSLWLVPGLLSHLVDLARRWQR